MDVMHLNVLRVYVVYGWTPCQGDQEGLGMQIGWFFGGRRVCNLGYVGAVRRRYVRYVTVRLQFP